MWNLLIALPSRSPENRKPEFFRSFHTGVPPFLFRQQINPWWKNSMFVPTKWTWIIFFSLLRKNCITNGLLGFICKLRHISIRRSTDASFNKALSDVVISAVVAPQSGFQPVLLLWFCLVPVPYASLIQSIRWGNAELIILAWRCIVNPKTQRIPALHTKLIQFSPLWIATRLVMLLCHTLISTICKNFLTKYTYFIINYFQYQNNFRNKNCMQSLNTFSYLNSS